MVIRVMTLAGCPNCEATRVLVEQTVKDLRLAAVIEDVQVNSEAEARQRGFLGSPTIQVDGRDIEAARRTDTATLACRIYRTQNGLTGVPPRELLVDAIREAERRSH